MANGISLNKEMSNQSFEVTERVNMFLGELIKVVKKHDCIGPSVRYEEFREYGHVEHEYYILNEQNMSPLELVPTIKSIERDMKEFSIKNGMYDFYISSRILFER